ncbi:Rpn family recombination-promoting nuclease/putative transposase [Erwinia sp. BC051422]|jgi:predicted transposase/invertase (TIGR01784 family)|nr:Rpn family recombination-promoting nuclease/putative transposase [Erwinia sp. BC051422]MDN8540227.1 Rpn family recombination-promoting nuclease/putative transposase [Erwinia sp. BC051422]
MPARKRKKITRTPHDAVFKQFLTDPAVAKDFMAQHLSESVRAACDFSTLRLASGSFVEESLRACFSDVLYSLKTAGGDGYIYVLIEHQSTPDRHMAFRLLRYAVAVMQRHLDAGHTKLPLVIPVLFYNGKRSPYPFSTHWLHGFTDPDMAGRIYGTHFPLVDVTAIPDDEIVHHRKMAALTLVQKHIHQRDMTDLLDRLTALILAGDLTEQHLISLVNYLLLAGEASDAKVFVQQLAQRVPQHEEKLMTIAQQLKQTGVQEGMKMGVEKGMRKGMRLGRKAEARNIARAMLRQGFDLQAVATLTGLSKVELAQLYP